MARLVAEHGLVSLTMSQIAEQAGIGRATLYKYFPDAQAVLTAWHERQITAHLDQLTAAADPAAPRPSAPRRGPRRPARRAAAGRSADVRPYPVPLGPAPWRGARRAAA